MVVSMNLTTQNAKVITFYYETQITAIAANGNTVSISMAMLPNCENEEIANAFTSTFGIPIDRYLIYVYEYGSYQPLLSVLDLLSPVSLEVPEELLGTAQYSTINGYMKTIASANGRTYTPIESAGIYELDAVGFLGYNNAIPDRI